MTTVKHYALNSMENARFTVDVTIDEGTLREAFLPHFRAVVEAGADAVMTAYNSVNGEWAGQNRHLITEILRDDWGFPGIAVSDFIWGLRDAVASLDGRASTSRSRSPSSAPSTCPRRSQADPSLWDDVDARRHADPRGAAALRRPPRPPTSRTPRSCSPPTHRALAREAAARAMVLLKNEPVDGAPVLPLDPAVVRTVAVAGRARRRARTPATTARPTCAPPPSSPRSTACAAALDDIRVLDAGDEPGRRRAAAADADAAVVVVGYTAEDEGEYIEAGAFLAPELVATYPPTDGDAWAEQFLGSQQPSSGSIVGGSAGGDRRSLRLHDADVALIRAVAAANPRTVVVLVAAGAVLIEEWRDAVPAVLLGWYAGSEGGPRARRRAARRGRCDRPAAVLGADRRGRTCPRSTRTPRPRYLRPVVRAAAARPARRPGRVPARLRPVLHVLRAARGWRSASPTARRCTRGSPSGTPATATAGTSCSSTASRRTRATTCPRRVLLGFASVAVGAGEARAGRPHARRSGRCSAGTASASCCRRPRCVVRAAAHAADASGPTARIRLG